MNSLRFSHLILIILCFGYSLSQYKSDLCQRCKCTPSKENSTKIDVDCTNVLILFEVLYHPLSWFDEKNNSIQYGRVIFTESSIGNLDKPFLPSTLNYLDLSQNGIINIKLNCFAELQEMHTLILSKNDINILKPDVFKGKPLDGENNPLKSLKILKLDNNNFHSLDQDLFEHIEDVLEILDLSYNPLKVLDQPTTIAITSIIYLKELYLRFTQIKKLPENFLHTPRHLKLLDLSGNNFRRIPKELQEVHVLETLYFNNNPIVNITSENGFPNMSTLKALYLCYNIELECIGARALGGLEKLSDLHICNNMKLNHIDPAALCRTDVENEIWPPLKKLYLEGNQLATIYHHLVLNWDHLEELDLRYNPWTCDCENQWIVETLMPIYVKINETLAMDMKCGAPIEMESHSFYLEYKGNKSMRCLDYYGSRPERDGTILIGVLIGLLLEFL